MALAPVLLLVYGSMVYIGFHLRIGMGPWEYVVIPVAMAIFLALITAAVYGILAVCRLLPTGFVAVASSGLLLVTLSIAGFVNNVLPAVLLGLGTVFIQIVLGSSFCLLLFSKRNKVVPLILLFAAIGVNSWGLWWLLSPGSISPEKTAPIEYSIKAGVIRNFAPLERGPWRTAVVYYGSGRDRRREEYGAKADLITPVVDAEVLLPDMPDWQRKVRAWYWGFDLDRLPLNARVWMPEGDGGPFPLVLIVHGNHQMEEYSDPGYEYLGEHLASRGYIAASIDENFLNGSWTGNIKGENQVRAWLLLQHLKQWETWARVGGNPFYGKVDMERIALVGHSRGGEAAALAGAFNKLDYNPQCTDLAWDFNFSIDCIIALSPTDGQFLPAGKPVVLEDINYLVLQGSYDADIYSFLGLNQWERVNLSNDSFCYKASVYIEGANHGQFNTVWGRKDLGEPLSRFLHTAPILSPLIQKEVAKAYITAFLDLTLKNQQQNAGFFQEAKAIQNFFPEVNAILEYRDSSFLPLATFEEDIDVTTATIADGRISAVDLVKWRELMWGADGRTHGHRPVASLGWADGEGAYILDLSNCQLFEGKAGLTDLCIYLSVADNSPNQDYPLNFGVEVSDGITRSRLEAADYAPVGLRFHRQLAKGKLMEKWKYDSPYEPVTQTVILPMEDFVKNAPRLNVNRLREIRLRFDRVAEGEIILSELGIGGIQ